MAILLIFDRDNTHPDPEKDVRGCWKRGMVVEVFEDDKPLVLPPAEPFYLVKIAGVTKAQAEKYMAAHTDAEGRILCRRLYKLDTDIIPLAVKKALRDYRYFETDWPTVRNYIRNLLDGTVGG
jgi:hypothetical protein